MNAALLIAQLTFTEFRRNRWVWSISAIFTILVLGLSMASKDSIGGLGSFDRLSAMVLNIVLLFIPLIGFLLGAQLIARYREMGALVYLLSHPVRKSDIFLGMIIGAYAVIIVSLSIGFGAAGILIAFQGFQGIASYLALWLFSLLFAFLCVSIGLFISVISSNYLKSMALAAFSWLIFTIFSDLGLLGTSYVLNLETEKIIAIVLLNPLETFKILVIKLIASNLEVLGAGGIYFDLVLGHQMIPLLISWLILVSLFFLAGGMWLFTTQEEN